MDQPPARHLPDILAWLVNTALPIRGRREHSAAGGPGTHDVHPVEVKARTEVRGTLLERDERKTLTNSGIRPVGP